MLYLQGFISASGRKHVGEYPVIKLHQNTILHFMIACYNYCEFVGTDMVFMLFAISLMTVLHSASVLKSAGDSFPNT
jgi:hypothetical protein